MDISLYQQQYDYFYNLKSKYRIMPKGRRVGFTHGAANYCILEAFAEDRLLLWVDTVQTNIDRYVERYFLPALKEFPSNMWSWRPNKKELTIMGSKIDMRSADRPENLEGFGYHRIILNEAGIILKGDKGRYLFNNTILPMTMDYEDCIVLIGGTPKGKRGKDGKICLFYEMHEKALSDNHPNYSMGHIITDQNPHLSDAAVEEVLAELPEGPIRDQEFYGKFVASVSGIIKDYWFHIDETAIFGETVRSWDLAFTTNKANDAYAGAKVCNADKYQIQDMVHGRLNWPDLKQLIMSTAELDGPDVIVVIESGGTQTGYHEDIQQERRMQNYNIVGQRPEGDKLVRCMKWASRLKSQQCTMLRGEWNENFISEATAFTNDDSHSHDDQLDGVSGAYQYFNSTQIGIMSI